MSARGRGTPWRPAHGFRGGVRGRGGWVGPRLLQTVQTPALPLGQPIEILTPKELGEKAKHVPDAAKIEDCRLLASFNWMNGKEPSIVFPGEPPLWKPAAQATILNEDTGNYFRDQNAARYPQHPIEPAARAVLAQTPADFNAQDFDIFGCGSTLGNLLRFVRGEDKPFRFTVEAVGNTVFFIRRENKSDELLNWDGQPIRGYGHTFPDRYTAWQAGVEGSASHQRIISYDFCGLKCLVRFEADGYLGERVDATSNKDEDEVEAERDEEPLALMQLPNITTPTQKAGTPIPQSAIFDLKTRTIKRRDQVDEILAEQIARYWVAQIPLFILAFHERGRFSPEDILVQDVRKDVDKWQNKHQSELRKLGVLLEKLVQLARDSVPDHKYEVVCQTPNGLEIREQGGKVNGPLCEELRQVWLGSPAGSDGDSEASGGARSESDEPDDERAYSDADSDRSMDYTACDSECGYCGRCKY